MSNVYRGQKIPNGLTGAGRELYVDVLNAYELQAHEVAQLEQACRTLNLVGALQRKINRDGISAKGSMGQIVVSPFVVELRQQRALLASQIRALGLPEIDTAAISGTSSGLRVVPNQQRAAIQSRWAKAHG